MNSNLELFPTLSMCKACVVPRTLETTVLVFIVSTQVNPIERLNRLDVTEYQIMRRLVTSSLPRSPRLPLVSSMESSISSGCSPLRIVLQLVGKVKKYKHRSRIQVEYGCY